MTMWNLKAFLVAVFAFPIPTVTASAPDVSVALQKILNQAHQGPLYVYPTSLTQGIIPVRADLSW